MDISGGVLIVDANKIFTRFAQFAQFAQFCTFLHFFALFAQFCTILHTRLARGINNIGIESGACDWAMPKDTWSNVTFPPEVEANDDEDGHNGDQGDDENGHKRHLVQRHLSP